MVSGAFCIWQLLALTGTAKQNEVMVLFTRVRQLNA